MDNIYETWGLRVRAMRRALRLTQSELAALTQLPNVTQETISRVERGERPPSLRLGLALAHALGCPPDVLFPTPSTHPDNGALAA